ncbi:cobalt-zinc-cadmium resistance protein [Pigmentiphaga sp. NML030171]|uniref:TolC family protein n=1 Tax=Pigmentiphaga sp. NML030171 TaxID=2008676 RepID=UPI000B40C1C3|nr:TolC family protein [Pigmentiphaga sp. NML030171]OVZ61924.1 cobalt-zinc-cadmium resistance protein [Pigmentiphaga sp. NML030171]
MRRLLWPLGLAAALSSPMAAAQPRPDPVPVSVPVLDQVPAAGGPLTLESALAMAAAGNPALAAAAKEAEALQGGVVQARVLPNPDIAFAVEDARRDSRTTSVELGIPIELGGKRSARILAAERAQTVAVAEFTRARAQLRAATVAAFFDLLIAQEGVALANGSAQVAARAADIAARRVAAGKVPPLEETRARVERANADLEVEAARARLQEARRTLGSLWGEPDPRFGQAVGSLDVLPARAPVDALLRELEQAPELAAHRLEIERRDAVVGVERSKRYPDVRLTAGTQRNNELGRNQTLLGVSIPLPLFDRNQGNLYEATVRADQARDVHRALQVRLAQELRQASAQLELARKSADALRGTVLPGAREAYEAATRGFEAGKSGFLDVLDAQRTLFQARIRYLAVLADTYQAAIAIDRVLGR